MPNAVNPEPPGPRLPEDRLDSWKEIAAHLRRGERTVRRWEQTEGLPVYRHSHQKQATVYAFRSELNAWLEDRGDHLAKPEEATAAPEVAGAGRRKRLLRAWPIVAAVAMISLAWLFGRGFSEPRRPVRITPLTSYSGSENYPSISPDGKLVAFSWAREEDGDFDIYILEIGSQRPRRLTENPGNEVGAVWSPDGRSVVFLRSTPGKGTEIILAPAMGGPERRVAGVAAPNVRAPQYGGWLAWSPDGKWLVTVDWPSPTEPRGLFLVSPESGEKRRLTSSGLGDFAPAFSPDGRTLAFVRSRAWTVSDVFVLPMGQGYQLAGPPKPITVDGRFVTSPAWTRDGRAILFCSGELWGFRKIYQVAAFPLGDRPVPATPLPIDIDEGSIFTASFAGPGKGGRLIYARQLFDPNIWMTQLAGAEGKAQPARKIISSTRADLLPQFSPDGKWIAYASSRSGNQEVWLSKPDGSQPTQLTSFGDKPSGTPRWSPDGRWIAFDSTHGGPGIQVISASGGVPRRITQRGRIPSWSRDGQWIYFVGHQVMKVAVTPPFTSQPNPVPVTPEGANAAFESTDGKSLYYSLRGSIWRMPTVGGEGQRVVSQISGWSDFAVVDQGIFFVSRADPGKKQTIRFYRFSTGEIRTVANLEKPIYVGMSASADGRSILYSQVDLNESDLMLADIP